MQREQIGGQQTASRHANDQTQIGWQVIDSPQQCVIQVLEGSVVHVGLFGFTRRGGRFEFG